MSVECRFTNVEEVDEWAERLRAERLNDTGRGLIDLAAGLLRSAMGAGEGLDEETLMPLRMLALRSVASHVDKAVRAAIVADKAEAERAIAKLRRIAEARESMADGFDEIH